MPRSKVFGLVVAGVLTMTLLVAPGVASAFTGGAATGAMPVEGMSFGLSEPPSVGDVFAPDLLEAEPEDEMHYYGGPVQSSPHVYLIFWGKNWELGTFEPEPGVLVEPAHERETLVRMFNALSGSAYQNILTQYSGDEKFISSTVEVSPPYIDNRVDAPAFNQYGPSYKGEIKEAIEANEAEHWSATVNSQFVILPAPGTTFEVNPGCGFHSHIEGTDTVFSYVAPPKSISRCDFVYVASHEYAEGVTDPFTPEQTAWRSEGGEIADVCGGGTAELDGIVVAPLWSVYNKGEYWGGCSKGEEPAPPQLSAVTESGTPLTGHEAMLHGMVNPAGRDSHYHFEWFVAGSGGKEGDGVSPEEELSGGSSVSVNATASGLKVGTAYEYRVVVVGRDKALISGKYKEVVTLGPRATPEAATSITSKKATLNATVNPERAATKYYFEYGTVGEGLDHKAPASAEGIGSGTEGVKVKQTIRGLEPGTTYESCVIAENEVGETKSCPATSKR